MHMAQNAFARCAEKVNTRKNLTLNRQAVGEVVSYCTMIAANDTLDFNRDKQERLCTEMNHRAEVYTVEMSAYGQPKAREKLRERTAPIVGGVDELRGTVLVRFKGKPFPRFNFAVAVLRGSEKVEIQGVPLVIGEGDGAQTAAGFGALLFGCHGAYLLFVFVMIHPAGCRWEVGRGRFRAVRPCWGVRFYYSLSLPSRNSMTRCAAYLAFAVSWRCQAP